MPCSWIKCQPQLFSIPGGETQFSSEHLWKYTTKSEEGRRHHMESEAGGREDAEPALAALSADWEKMCRIQLQ